MKSSLDNRQKKLNVWKERAWWKKFDRENLEVLKNVLSVTVRHLELNPNAVNTKISKKLYSNLGIEDTQVISILKRLSEGGTLFHVANEDYERALHLRKPAPPGIYKDNVILNFQKWGFTTADPKNRILLNIEDTPHLLDKLKIVQSQILEISRQLSDESKILRCGDLSLDHINATIRYKNNKPVNNVPLSRQEIRLLRLLMENKGILMGYIEIAEKVNPNLLDKVDKELRTKGENVSDDIHEIRKHLRNYLVKEVGMDGKTVNNMIITIKNRGYKLECPV